MKTMKTLLSVLLTTVLAAAMLSVGVSAEELTVTAITTDDLTLYQYGDGNWMSSPNEDGTCNTYEWFCYDITPKTYTVTFSDGSSFTGEPYEIYRQTGDWAQILDDQSATNEWELGAHTVTYSFGELTSSYTVTVIEAPVVSVSAEDVNVRQYVDGEYSINDDFLYTLDPIITVTFTDGTVITGTQREIKEKTGYLPRLRSTQGNVELSLGEHTASVIYMGVEAFYTVNVVDVVDSIELLHLPTRTMYIPYGAYFNLSGATLRVHFTDGTFEDIPLDAQHSSPTYTCETLGEDYILDILPARATASGTQDVTLRFLGETASYSAQVMSPPKRLTLRANEDHSLSITFEFTDESIDYSITKFSFSDGTWGSDGNIEANGTLYASDTAFYATLIKDGASGTVSIALGGTYMEGGVYAVSNSITDTVWFNEHNGIFVRGDFDGDRLASTTDVRMILSSLADYMYYDSFRLMAADLNNNGTIDTTDARLILKRVLA